MLSLSRPLSETNSGRRPTRGFVEEIIKVAELWKFDFLHFNMVCSISQLSRLESRCSEVDR